MGRWTFPEGGQPLYVPAEGESPDEGPGMLGHVGAQAAGALGGAYDSVMGAIGSSPVARGVEAVAGPLRRSVTAVGHSMDPAGYQGKTDPIDYIFTGQKEDPADLAGYGDLLADTMEAEGTIREGSAASRIVRKAGAAVSDPVILAGVARLAVKPVGRPPGPRPAPAAAPKAPGRPPGTRYRQPPIDRPSAASQWPSVPMDRDLASPGAFTRGGVGQMPKAPAVVNRGTALDNDLAGAGGAGRNRPLPRVRGNPPPAAARPLDNDLAYGGGPVRGLPKTKAAKSNARKLKRATKDMNAEFGPQPLPTSPGQMRMLIQAAVENGASADDVMQLISNFGG